jgi:transposase-like protein
MKATSGLAESKDSEVVVQAVKPLSSAIFKRQGQVNTEIVPDCSCATLQAVIRGRVSVESVIHSDRWRGYNGLVNIKGTRSISGSTTETMNLPTKVAISMR